MFGQTKFTGLPEDANEDDDPFDLNLELTRKDALRIQNLLNKITLLQVKELASCETKDEVYNKFLYIKPKLEDHFYLQTGLESAEFSLAAKRLLYEAQKVKLSYDASEFIREWEQMHKDYDEILEELNQKLAEIFDIQLLDELQGPPHPDSDDEIDPDEIEFVNRKQPQGTTKEESSKPGEDVDQNDDDEDCDEQEEERRNSDNVINRNSVDANIAAAEDDESDQGMDDVGADESLGSTNRKVRV